MKTGKASLTELAAELERQAEAKQDYIADTRAMTSVALTDDLRLAFGKNAPMTVQPTAHRQISTLTGIPAKYYDRMLADDPDLLSMNVNAWLGRLSERRMIRTMDGQVRAVLSDRYQRIDHADLAETILPVLMETQGVRVASCEVTDKRLYIKAVNEQVRGEVKVGDVVEAGVLITNSEVGHGAVAVTPLVHRLVCQNGMVLNDRRFRRHHVGAKTDIGDQVTAMLSDEALRADDRAVLLKTRDVVRGAMDQAMFGKAVAAMQSAAASERMEDPTMSVEALSSRTGILEGERKSVLRHLIEGGDLTKWGAVNAITRAAQDVSSYDRSTDLEEIGGAVLNLSPSQWREVAEAA